MLESRDYITKLLIPQSGALLETIIIMYQEISHILYKQRNYRVHKGPPLECILSEIIHNPTSVL
jgi:hypothetical protein